MFTQYITNLKPEKLEEQVRALLNLDTTYNIPEGQALGFAQKHVNLYNEVVSRPVQPQEENVTIVHYFIHEPFLEIRGNSKSKFLVKYFDEQGVCHFDSEIKTNNWVKLNRRWYTKWNIKKIGRAHV